MGIGYSLVKLNSKVYVLLANVSFDYAIYLTQYISPITFHFCSKIPGFLLI